MSAPDGIRSLEFRSTAEVVGVLATVWSPTPESARDELLAAVGTAFADDVAALRWVARWEGDANLGPTDPPTESASRGSPPATVQPCRGGGERRPIAAASDRRGRAS